MFGSRDVWFVFALPIFLHQNLHWSFAQSGGFLALWVIGYGIVQALAPLWVGGKRSGRAAPGARRVGIWTALLVVPLGTLAIALHTGAPAAVSLIAGLAAFGIVFATDSAMHSYLIVHYARGDQVSLNVGFYYMANAAGRLLGTVCSGGIFQWAGMGRPGLVACLGAALGLAALSAALCIPLATAERGRSRGSGP